MSFRTINYSVSVEDISPKTEQLAGVVGENNVTDLVFTLDSELQQKLEASEGETVFRVEASNGEGKYYSSALLTFDAELGSVRYSVPSELTAVGGAVTLHLVISKLLNGNEEKTLYSYPAKISFGNSPSNNLPKGLAGAVSSVLREIEQSEANAKASEQNAESSAEICEEVLAEVEQRAEQIDVEGLANALKTKKTSELIACDDTSPIEHKVGLCLKHKNLCTALEIGSFADGSFTVTDTENTAKRCVKFNIANSGYYLLTSSVPLKITAILYGGTISETDFTLPHKFDEIFGEIGFNLERVDGLAWTGEEEVEFCSRDYRNVTVTRYGKNLLNSADYRENNNLSFEKDGESFIIHGSIVDSTDSTSYKNGQIWFPNYTINVENITAYGMPIMAGVDYTVSFDFELLEKGNSDGKIGFLIYELDQNGTAVTTRNATKSVIGVVGNRVGYSINLNYDFDTKIMVCVRVAGNKVRLSSFQLEAGNSRSDFEPYTVPEVYTTESENSYNGIEDNEVKNVTSLYPSMTLINDGDCVMQCEYSRDLVKVIAKIEEKLYDSL